MHAILVLFGLLAAVLGGCTAEPESTGNSVMDLSIQLCGGNGTPQGINGSVGDGFFVECENGATVSIPTQVVLDGVDSGEIAAK